MQRKLFRQTSLERLSSPEQLDQLLQVTTPRGWLALTGLGGLLIMAVLWGIFGTVQNTKSGQGILIRGSRIQLIEAPKAGQIVRLNVQPGDSVQQGQTVASLLPADQSNGSNPVAVTSPYAGRVVEIRVNEGGIVQAGTPMLSLESINAELQAILYLSPADGKEVQPGMSVQVSPSNVPQQQYGVLMGKVSSVGAYPATYDGMLAVLGNEDLARMLSREGAPIEVRVELIKADTPSGYKWSSPQGPASPVQSGTFCTASVTISNQAPISLVLGGSR